MMRLKDNNIHSGNILIYKNNRRKIKYFISSLFSSNIYINNMKPIEQRSTL